jgi:Cytochrome c7 and related cytochrome c/Class III cytochrome C family
MTAPRGLVAAAASGFLLFLIASALPFALRRSAVQQPIAFNHQKHVKDNDLACSTCHEYYEKEAFSGLPTSEICSSCHLEPQGKSAEELKLVRLLKAGAPLDWKPLFLQPPHVYYSHRRHVMTAKIDCPVCHGGIAQTSFPPARVPRLKMADCIGCHEKRGAPTECTACHR